MLRGIQASTAPSSPLSKRLRSFRFKEETESLIDSLKQSHRVRSSGPHLRDFSVEHAVFDVWGTDQ